MTPPPEQLAVLVFTLAQGDGPHDEVDAQRERFAVALGEHGEHQAYDVLAEVDGRWTGGGVDLGLVPDETTLDACAAAAAAVAGDAVARLYATRRVEVSPVVTGAGLHVFTRGGGVPSFTREAWQRRWVQHGELALTQRGFLDHTLGYVQFHGVLAERSAALGIDDSHGIGQFAFHDEAARVAQLSTSDYVQVLRPDEDEFVTRDRGMRVFTVRR